VSLDMSFNLRELVLPTIADRTEVSRQ
jgi:hypothetical protein